MSSGIYIIFSFLAISQPKSLQVNRSFWGGNPLSRAEMSLSSSLYNVFFRRTSTFAMTIVTAAFFFERTFDVGVEYMWRANNKGKLWEDLKDKYEQES